MRLKIYLDDMRDVGPSLLLAVSLTAASAVARDVAVSPQANYLADSTYSFYTASRAFDDNPATQWLSNSGVGPRAGVIGSHYLQVVWNAPVKVDSILVEPTLAGLLTAQKFQIQKLTGTDPLLDASWTTISLMSDYGSGTSTDPYYGGGAPFVFNTSRFSTKGIRINIPWSTQYVQDYYTIGGGFDYDAQKFAQINSVQVHGATTWADYTTLSSTGGARATAYPGGNRVISTGSGSTLKTHVAWVDYTGSNNLEQADASRLMFQSYDRTTRTWSAPQNLGSVADNHGGATICEDSNGRLSMVYGAHNSTLKFRQMPVGSTSYVWGAEPAETLADYSTYTVPGTQKTNYQATYPSMVADADTPDMLHLVFRGGSGSTKGIEYFRREYTTKPGIQGWRWFRKATLVYKPLNPNASYTEFGNSLGIGESGTLHMAYHFQQQTGTDTYTTDHVGYMKSTDHGTTWRSANGTALTLPALPDSGPTLVTTRAGSDFAVSNVDVDATDQPWFTVTDRTHKTFDVYNYNGTSWKTRDLTPIFRYLDPAFNVVGDAQLAVKDTNGEIMIVASYLSGTQTWAQTSSEVALLRSTDNGESWLVKNISVADPTTANWAAVLEHDTGGNSVTEPMMMYTHGNWDAVNTQPRFVDGSDLSLLDGFYFPTIMGDVNRDGVISSVDFNLLALNYGRTFGATWASGDFSGDGKVNTVDFNYLAANFGLAVGQPPVASLGTIVPEPVGTLSWMVFSLLLARQRGIKIH